MQPALYAVMKFRPRHNRLTKRKINKIVAMVNKIPSLIWLPFILSDLSEGVLLSEASGSSICCSWWI